MGSVSKAAQSLNKVHSAVLYSMRAMEEQTNLKLFDRSGYRTRLTTFGQRLWQECQKLLELELGLDHLLKKMTGGWEPYLKVVFDGVLPFDFIMRALRELERKGAPTKVFFYSDYLSKVEETFLREGADIMVSVLPPETKGLSSEKILGLNLALVAHKDHELNKRKRPWSLEELKSFTYLTVRGSDFRLQLSTAKLEDSSQFFMSDFQSKKEALMNKLGYGWMPEHLIRHELKRKTLVPVKWEGKSHHVLQPHLVSRGPAGRGQACELVLNQLNFIMSKN